MRAAAGKADPAGREAGKLSALADTVARALAEGTELTLEMGQRRAGLDEGVARALVEVLEVAARGDTVVVSGLPAVLTTGQAAELLGVSRPTVVSLVDAGEIPATRVGTRRRLELADVLAYRAAVRAGRRARIDELTRVSQELGLYQ